MSAHSPRAHLRLAHVSEFRQVHEVTQKAFAEHARWPNPSSALRETLEQVRAQLTEAYAVVAFEGARCLAAGRFQLSGGPARPAVLRAAQHMVVHNEKLLPKKNGAKGTLSFERLAVLPSHRGLGIGSQMISWLEQLAWLLSLEAVRTTVRSQQPDMRPYYIARGYEIEGYSGRYGIADIRTHMVKRLP